MPAKRPSRGAASDREQGVDRAHADIERHLDQGALHRIDRAAKQRHPILAAESALAVDRSAGAVDHPAQQFRPDHDLHRPTDRRHARANRQPVAMSLGDQQALAAVETHHFGGKLSSKVAFDEATFADRDMHAVHFHHEPDIAHQTAADFCGRIGFRQPMPVALERVDQALRRR